MKPRQNQSRKKGKENHKAHHIGTSITHWANCRGVPKGMRENGEWEWRKYMGNRRKIF
jgi:hypothetical protein